MPKSAFIILSITSLLSCSQPKFSYKNDIGSLVLKGQVNIDDKIIERYANLSDTGKFYKHLNTLLDDKAYELMKMIEEGQVISDKQQADFISEFEKHFFNYGGIDHVITGQLKSARIKTISDIDLIRLYLKHCFVTVLNDNKILPFDEWGVMGIPKSYLIKEGENIEIDYVTRAFKHFDPPTYYILKDGNKPLQKDNVSDTLRSDELGYAHYITRHYHIGKNVIYVAAMQNDMHGTDTVVNGLSIMVK
jgi:hypothetical protein